MVKYSDYKMGSIVELKKSHPSGTKTWEVVRTGLDVKLKSVEIKDTYIILPRIDFHKRVKGVLHV